MRNVHFLSAFGLGASGTLDREGILFSTSTVAGDVLSGYIRSELDAPFIVSKIMTSMTEDITTTPPAPGASGLSAWFPPTLFEFRLFDESSGRYLFQADTESNTSNDDFLSFANFSSARLGAAFTGAVFPKLAYEFEMPRNGVIRVDVKSKSSDLPAMRIYMTLLGYSHE